VALSGLVNIMISLAIGILTAVGVIRLAMSYVKGDGHDSKHEIKHFIIVCFFLGMLPGLGPLAIETGKAVVKPVTAIIHSVSGEVEKEATKVKGK
jgi:hypothetical protein